MKYIDVITLSENTANVMSLANQNGAIDCSLGMAVDIDSQNIQIIVPDDKHQAVFKALQTYLSSSSISSSVIRPSEKESLNDLNMDLTTRHDLEDYNQADLSFLFIIFLLICAVSALLFQVLYEVIFSFFE